MFELRILHGHGLRRSTLSTNPKITSYNFVLSRQSTLKAPCLNPYQITRPASNKSSPSPRTSWSSRRSSSPSPLRPPEPSSPPQYSPPPRPSRERHLNIVPGIIVVCTGVYGWVYFKRKQATDGSRAAMIQLATYRENMVSTMRNIQEGRYWTLITPIFAHGSFLHLLFNMFALSSFGPLVNVLFGTRRFVALFFGSGVAGSLAGFAWNKSQHMDPDHGAVGASGALCGLLGAVAVLMPRGSMSIMAVPVDNAVGAGLTAAFSVLALKEGWLPGIAHADHLGGLAFGALYVFLMLKRRRRL